MFRVTTLVLAMLSISALAQEGTILMNCLDTARQLYRRGTQNNNIDYNIYDCADCTKDSFRSNLSPIDATPSRLASLLKECVFMAKGAYEPHLSADQQDELTRKMINYLNSFPKLRYYRFQGHHVANWSTFTAPCSMGIKDGSQLILIQAGGED